MENLLVLKAVYNTRKEQDSCNENFIYKITIQYTGHNSDGVYNLLIKWKKFNNGKWNNYYETIRNYKDTEFGLYFDKLVGLVTRNTKNDDLALALFNYILIEYCKSELTFYKAKARIIKY